jgi:NADH dehydrogenase FAD-containing subunit
MEVFLPSTRGTKIMAQRIVFIGAGHAHLTCLLGLGEFLRRGAQVFVVGPADKHYYSGMGPGLLGGSYAREQIRFPVQAMTEAKGGHFLNDRVVKVDAQAKALHLASGKSLEYDIASFNTGSGVPKMWKGETPEGIYPVKPVEILGKAADDILTKVQKAPVCIVVAGGGPAALEVAGNARGLLERVGTQNAVASRVVLAAGSVFMRDFPDGVRRRALENFKLRGIEIRENVRVESLEKGAALLETGERISADVLFWAVGVTPSPLFRDSGLPVGPDGGLMVDEYLKCPDHPELFGGGDCIHHAPKPLDKVGVYAVRQNPVLFNNILATLEGRPLERFDPGGEYLLAFNLGDGTGIVHKKGVIFGGRAGFVLKDLIDRTFMQKFRLADL